MGTHAEKDRIFQTIDFLCARYSKAFSRKRSEIRPLKPGIVDDLVADLGAEEFRQPVRHALGFYQTRMHYLSKVVSGKWYRDIHGNRVGLVSEDEKLRAKTKLENIRSNNRPQSMLQCARSREKGGGRDWSPDEMRRKPQSQQVMRLFSFGPGFGGPMGGPQGPPVPLRVSR